jgi:hypothetical protein
MVRPNHPAVSMMGQRRSLISNADLLKHPVNYGVPENVDVLTSSYISIKTISSIDRLNKMTLAMWNELHSNNISIWGNYV